MIFVVLEWMVVSEGFILVGECKVGVDFLCFFEFFG